MNDKELKDECMENAEIDLRKYSNNELMQIRDAMRMYADRKFKLFTIPDVSESCLAKCDVCGCHPSVIIRTEFGTFCQAHARFANGCV